MSKPAPQVRIDPVLYEAVTKVAKKHRRSIAAEINDVLANWLEVSEEWALPPEE